MEGACKISGLKVWLLALCLHGGSPCPDGRQGKEAFAGQTVKKKIAKQVVINCRIGLDKPDD
jgi:hypothetical protein